MIRAAIILATLATIPAHAQDNNPFSGATSISVAMTREVGSKIAGSGPVIGKKLLRRKRPTLDPAQPFRLHCTLNGKPMADWRGNAIRFKGDVGWATIPPDAAGPMILLLWAGGARCGRL